MTDDDLSAAEMESSHLSSTSSVSQDDILRQTKSVVQGLDALRADHKQMLASLQAKNNNASSTDLDMTTVDDRINILVQSLEKLELGIGEAQVNFLILTPRGGLCLFGLQRQFWSCIWKMFLLAPHA